VSALPATTTASVIRVVLVEDSPTQRAFLRRSLEADGDIVVVGEATTAASAVAVVAKGRPDVVALDLEIPGGGQAAIEAIMQETPRPILLLSALIDGPRSTAAADAIRAGAAGVLPKPETWDAAAERTLRGRVRAIRGARLRPALAPARRRGGLFAPAPAGPAAGAERFRPGALLAIAASTGGPAALSRLLADLRGLPVPVLLVQHIHPQSVAGLATWLERTTGWTTKVATAGVLPAPGEVLLAPAGRHLALDVQGRVALRDDPDGPHKPSADELFLSLARAHAARTVGCILTGMGSDGAHGLAMLRRAGGSTVAQDESSSAVFGMAKAAIDAGAVERVAPLDALAVAIRRSLVAR
jgi:two-component system chemotaxis response regulator CheB